ncbi:dCMP deaminase [Vibrio phage F86]
MFPRNKQYYDLVFLDIAKSFAKKSTCRQKSVGAVIVKNDRIISHGYNGVPSGVEHCNQTESYGDLTHREWSEIHEIHAEQNAISYAARAGIATDGATMYVTTSPCHTCAKLIVASGIKILIVGSIYSGSQPDWYQWLEQRGVTVISFDEEYV